MLPKLAAAIRIQAGIRREEVRQKLKPNIDDLGEGPIEEMLTKLSPIEIARFSQISNWGKIAANNAGYGNKFDDILNGQVGIAYGYDDPTSPAKAIKNFLNENKDAIEVLGIYFDGELYGPEKYSELASLPSKDELLSKLASGLNYPMTQLASTLNGAMSKLAGILDSLKNIK